jgi:hypothetical protein
LLDRAEAEGFQLLIVADKNFQHQQNLQGRRIAILELWTNHRPTLEKISETDYLVRSAANAKRLISAVNALNRGNVTRRTRRS